MLYFPPELMGVLTAAFVIFLGLYLRYWQNQKKVSIIGRVEADREKMEIDNIIRDLETEETMMKEENLSWFQRKERELNQSNTGISMLFYMGLLSSSVLLIYLLVYKIIGIAWFAVPFAFLGVLVPDRVVQAKRTQNINDFNEQLIKALRRMGSVMKAGGSLKQGLLDVTRARSVPLIIRIEFKRVLADVEYGMSIERALFNLYQRTGSKDIRFLAIAVEIQRQLGGNIADIFDTVAQTIANRNQMESEVRATLAQVKTTSKILSAMPFAMGGLLYLMSPTYFQPLFEELTGRMIFLGCMLFIVLGIFVMQKFTSIEI